MTVQSSIEAPALNAALVAALAEIGGAVKGKSNPDFKSKYADLGAVMDAVKPALSAHGLGFTQHCRPADDGVCIETVVRHVSGAQESLGILYVPLGGKKDAQAVGSALSYGRRYALMTAFGVPAEDDDGNAASRSAPRADPAPVRMATGDQRDTILTMAPVVGKSVQEIVEAYRVSALDELTEAQAAATIKRLQSLKPVEPANA